MYTISVLDFLEETTQKHYDRNAVIDEKESITYGSLQMQAKIVGYALHLVLQGAVQKPVLLFMEKSCRCVTAMMGILYSGNIYVPMDVKTPLKRMQSILCTLESDCILTSAEDALYLRKVGYQGNVLIYEELIEKYSNTLDESALKKIRENMIDTDLMYILFTSGSTGVPKGVAVTHRSVVDYIESLEREVDISCDDIIGNQAPFYADMSLRDIYMPVKAGAVNCIIPQKLFMSPKKVLQYMDDKRVTFIMWVPTAYRIVAQFDGLSRIRPAYLNRFWFSGEAMPVQVYRYWRTYYPAGRYAQLYGPTEITGACTFFNVISDYRDGEVIPVGRPLKNTGIVLLDENDKEIKSEWSDVVGEICVFGSCLAAGYYNDRKRTEEVFVQSPLVKSYGLKIYRTGDLAKWDDNGNLIFVSRKDYQIKHAGKRVELGEIETAIQSIQGIEACCCIHDRDKDTLVLFYIGNIDAGSIMKLAQEKVPKYMVPQVIRKENELPILANGKLDRKMMDKWVNEKKGMEK